MAKIGKQRSSRGLLLSSGRVEIAALGGIAALGREVLAHEDRLHFLSLPVKGADEESIAGGVPKMKLF